MVEITRRNKEKINMEDQIFSLEPPDSEQDPVRFYEHREKNEKFARFAITSYNKEKDEIINVGCALNTDTCVEWSGDQMREVEALGMKLHSLLIEGDKESRTRRYDPLAYPTCNALTELSLADKSPLRLFVHALAYGDRLENLDKDSTLWDKIPKTSFAATEIIRHLRSDKPGAIKDILGAQLLAQDVPNSVFDILNDFGLACSKDVMMKADDGYVTMKLESGLENIVDDRYALVITYYDNMGFKQRAVRVGYKQYTKQIHVVVSREELIALGIYRDPTKPLEEQKYLDQTRKSWLTERGTYGFKEVCGLNGADNNCLAGAVMMSIGSLLKAKHDGKLPTFDQSTEMLESLSIQWPDTIPDTYGARKMVNGDNGTAQYVASEREYDSDSDDEDDNVPPLLYRGGRVPETPLGANNATIEVPMERDLNEKDTCIVLANYCLAFREVLLAIGIKDGDPLKDAIPIMEDYGINLAGDGLPSHLLTRIKRENPEMYEKLLNITFGGFHTGLNGWKSNGKLFAEALLNDIFSLWRSSEKQLKWVMEPGDPNQIEDETTMYVLAQYSAAIDGYIAVLEKQENPTFDVKVTDVIEHMISRAKQHKIVMVTLIQLRVAECLFLLLDSESNRDEAMYRTALKFLTIFFCSSHSPKYVSLGSDFFVNHHCSSEADQALFEHVLFRKTVNGHSIFGDRFVEWTIRDLRTFLGDFSTGDAHNSHVYRISLLLNDKKILRNVTKSESNVSQANKQRHLRINKVYCETYVYVMEANFWGVGDPIQVPALPWVQRKGMDRTEWTKNDGTTPSGGARLNDELCFPFSEGVDRWGRYFSTYLVKGDINSATRSETDQGVSLKLLEGTQEAREEREKNRVDRAVSVDHAFVNKKGVYKAAEIRAELRSLNDKLPDGTRKFKPSSYKRTPDETVKKEHYAYAVVDARKKLIETNPQWVATTKAAILDSQRATREGELAAFQNRVNKELDQTMFNFNGCNAREDLNLVYRMRGATDTLQEPSQELTQQSDGTSIHGASAASASASTGGFGTTNLDIATPEWNS